MNKIALPLLASLLVFGTAQAADYKLDPTHTKAVFYVSDTSCSISSIALFHFESFSRCPRRIAENG